MENESKFKNQSVGEVSEKSSLIALVLALFLGGLGAHRFYVGKTKTAILILLITLLVLFFKLIPFIFEEPPEWMFSFIMPLAYLIFGFQFFVGIWILIDIIKIFLGKFKDKEGKIIK